MAGVPNGPVGEGELKPRLRDLDVWIPAVATHSILPAPPVPPATRTSRTTRA